jgi:hypothetical protein
MLIIDNQIIALYVGKTIVFVCLKMDIKITSFFYIPSI